MAPIIHCVRHAQGFHNLSIAAHSIYDPMLTPFGEQQCRELQHDFPHHDRVALIVASPLRRTMYTALISFEDTIKRKNLTVVALPEIQETSDLPCDTGSSPEDLASEFASKPADLSLVGEGWNNKRGRWAPTAQAIEDRAKATREWLMARPEKEIVLVTHGAFLHYFTQDWADCEKYAGTGWANTEFRSYEFAESVFGEAILVETTESRTRRLGSDSRPLTPTEQAERKRSAEIDWDREGYVLQHLPADATAAQVAVKA